jgi:hypothetical protein
MTRRKPISVICLLTYLLGWVTGAQAAPVFVTLAGHVHKTFISYEHSNIRIILHHPGNVDEHQPQAGHHRHDALDWLIAAVTGFDTHMDHVLCLPLRGDPAALAAPGADPGKTPSRLPATGYAFPSFVASACVHRLARPPPAVDPALLLLRSTILLI